MGSTNRGWARVRKQVVLANIRRCGIVFLQEVPWAVRGTKKHFATPARYKVVMTKSRSGNRNSCILYNPRKLRGVDADTKTINKTIESVQGKAYPEYTKRLCVKVFALEGRRTTKFVAISLHAPRKNTKHFCNVVKASIKKVVAVHKLPVLVGGDFNSDMYGWKNEGFLGPHEARHKRIDFIMMKVPKRNNLKIAKVQVHEDIAIPKDVQKLEVMREGKRISVKAFSKCFTNTFYQWLCDNHMPMTGEIS